MESLKRYENVHLSNDTILPAGRSSARSCFHGVLVSLENGSHRRKTYKEFIFPYPCPVSQFGSSGCLVVELAGQRLRLESLACFSVLLYHCGVVCQLPLFDGKGALPAFKRSGSSG